MPDRLFIGLMSGTSADDIDAALVSFDNHDTLRLMATAKEPIADLKADIHQLAIADSNEIYRMGQLDRELGIRFSQAVTTLLSQTNTHPGSITAIGSHGQTIRHYPETQRAEEHSFTLQVGDPNTIAQLTGITTVADFRRRDMVLGGQGAPLVPAFHRAVFADSNTNRAIVNIGGVANITVLPRDKTLPVTGFDCGPGNNLMDTWIHQQQGSHYDKNGEWAATGTIAPALLEQLLATPYLHQPPPKSTGRELFSPNWLTQQLSTLALPEPPANIQATLLEFTAQTITNAIMNSAGNTNAVFLCGGGANNPVLMERIDSLLDGIDVKSTEALGIHHDWVEAIAFAWLAKQTLDGLPGNLPAVTGASEATILGAIYPG